MFAVKKSSHEGQKEAVSDTNFNAQQEKPTKTSGTQGHLSFTDDTK